MPTPDILRRRATRVAMLAARWAAYVARHPHKPTALADARRWLSTTLGARHADPLGYGVPWICFPAVRWLEATLRPGLRIFEWGSGNSTLFFARHGAEVVCIEHDAAWHGLVRDALALHRIEAVRLLHHPLPPDAEDAAGSAYVRAIDDFPDQTFDLIFVDGRCRVACLEAARAKVRPGGCIVLDNAERPRYAPAFDGFPASDWQVTHFEGPVADNIWPAFSRATVFTRTPPSCPAS